MENTCSVSGCNRPRDRLGLCTRHYMRNRRHGTPTGGVRADRGAALEFLERVVCSDSDECILWPFNSSKRTGYGSLRFRGRNTTAHRAALILHTGIDAPGSVQAAHAPEICHNRLCVNPRHLRWATASENEQDKALDKTVRIGEELHNAVLTNAQADMIREIPGPAWAVALAFGVSQAVIHNVRAGRTYK